MLFMAGGIKLWVMILLLGVLIYPSTARMGYDIIASAGGPTFEVHRETKYMSFSLDGTVRGSGNFSRLDSITEQGVTAKEATSCTKNGSLDYSEQISLATREGPVIVTVNLNSYNLTNQTGGPLKIKESAHITVDEQWPIGFANYKRIAYSGKLIRTRERYENNGDVVATAINSWDLSKESIYRVSNNRTVTFASITPVEVKVDVASNKSSYYALGLKTTGELTNLNVIQRDPSQEIAHWVNEDYRGAQNMNVAIKMNSIYLNPPQDQGWLDCCSSGSMYERLFGNGSF
jgi:hypothetical protein